MCVMMVGVPFLCAVDNCAGRHAPFSGQAYHASSSTACRPFPTLSSPISEPDADAHVGLMVQKHPGKIPVVMWQRPWAFGEDAGTTPRNQEPFQEQWSKFCSVLFFSLDSSLVECAVFISLAGLMLENECLSHFGI